MINMISIIDPNNFEKQPNSTAEISGAEFHFEDFAARLKTSISKNRFSQKENSSEPEKAADETQTVESDPTQPVNPFQIVTPENIFVNNSIEQTASAEIKNDLITAFVNPKQSDSAVYFPNQTNGKLPQTNTPQAEFLIQNNIDSGKLDVLEVTENKANNVLPDNSIFTFIKNDALKTLPKLFGEISKVFKNQETANPKSSSPVLDSVPDQDFSGKFSTLNESKLDEFNLNNTNIDQPAAEKIKSEKSSEETQDNLSNGFGKFTETVSKSPKPTETVSPESSKSSEVFEQVKPQMTALANLIKNENEKKTLKMRLHPAELGTVEIKLEKNASGKLVAHLQTESETTKQILTESLEQLRNSLQNSGWQIEHLEISSGSFSSAAHDDRENPARQFEANEIRTDSKANFNNSSGERDDSNSANRLLSVRA